MRDASGTQFFGLITVDTANNTVQNVQYVRFNQAGTQVAYAPTSDPTPCESGGGADFEVQVMCDRQANGNQIAFLRRITFTQAGALASTDFEINGTSPYTPTGQVEHCMGEHDLGEVCYETPGGPPAPQWQTPQPLTPGRGMALDAGTGVFTAATGGSRVATISLPDGITGYRFRANAGNSIFSTWQSTETGGAAVDIATAFPGMPTAPAAAGPFTATVNGVQVTVNQDGQVMARAGTGPDRMAIGAAPVAPANYGNFIEVRFNSPQNGVAIRFDALVDGTDQIRDLQVLQPGAAQPPQRRRARSVRSENGTVRFFDTVTGTLVTQPVTNCSESDPILLCDNNGAFLRHVTYTDGIASVRDTEVNGITPYVVQGMVRQCNEQVLGETCYMAPGSRDFVPVVPDTINIPGPTGTPPTYTATTTLQGNVRISGPIMGFKFKGVHPPDNNTILFRFATDQTNGFVNMATAFPAIPLDGVSPRAAGPFVGVVNGVEITVNPDGQQTTRWNQTPDRLALIDMATDDIEVRFDRPVTGVIFDMNLNAGEGLTDIQVMPAESVRHRAVTIKLPNGTVEHRNKETGAVVTGPFIPCLTDHAPVVLCDDNGPFMRHLFYGEEGLTTLRDTQLNGVTRHLPQGQVRPCDSQTVEACYLAPGPDVWQTVRPTTVTNFDNPTGQPPIWRATQTTGQMTFAGPLTGIRLNGFFQGGLGTSFGMDLQTAEQGVIQTTANFAGLPDAPPSPGIAGPLTGTDSNIAMTLNPHGQLAANFAGLTNVFRFDNQTLSAFELDWASPITNLQLNFRSMNVGAEGVVNMEVRSAGPQIRRRALGVRQPNGTISWVDSITGAAVPAANIIECIADVEILPLCDQRADGTVIPFRREHWYDKGGNPIGFQDISVTGARYAPLGIIIDCGSAGASIQPHLRVLGPGDTWDVSQNGRVQSVALNVIQADATGNAVRIQTRNPTTQTAEIVDITVPGRSYGWAVDGSDDTIVVGDLLITMVGASRAEIVWTTHPGS